MGQRGAMKEALKLSRTPRHKGRLVASPDTARNTLLTDKRQGERGWESGSEPGTHRGVSQRSSECRNYIDPERPWTTAQNGKNGEALTGVQGIAKRWPWYAAPTAPHPPAAAASAGARTPPALTIRKAAIAAPLGASLVGLAATALAPVAAQPSALPNWASTTHWADGTSPSPTNKSGCTNSPSGHACATSWA